MLGEALAATEKWIRARRLNPDERIEPPFRSDMVPNVYSHPNWLWKFEADDIESCHLLNIFLENFPVGEFFSNTSIPMVNWPKTALDDFNPASILQIDMFNTNEKKLHDQILKTMSVSFERNRRLTSLASGSLENDSLPPLLDAPPNSRKDAGGGGGGGGGKGGGGNYGNDDGDDGGPDGVPGSKKRREKRLLVGC